MAELVTDDCLTSNTQSLIFILDTTHKDLCIQYNRAHYYRYDLVALTASAYDDTDIFPQCAGKFVRPTTSNIIKGVNWELKNTKKNQILILSVLGHLTPDQINAMLKAFQVSKKKIKLVCVATEENTFKDFLTLNIPVTIISGTPEILLPLFDGRIINPKELSQIVTVKSNALASQDTNVLVPQPKPWYY
jgi:hypothetical protein